MRALAQGVLTAAAVCLAVAACRPDGGPAAERVYVSDFEDGSAAGWSPNEPEHWRVAADGGTMVYELTAPGAPGPVRAPASRSLLAGREASSFEFSGRLRCDADPAAAVRDLCVIFHYRDPSHFYYVHFAGTSDAVHNIIGLVDGADRVKINAEPAGASSARLVDRAWHRFKVTCDAARGEIRAYLDDMAAPILTARDRTFAGGLVGVGSFDDTGAFDDLRLAVRSR